MLAYHPTQNAVLFRRYGEMGEDEFCVDQGRRARQWIAANPGKFAEITVKRVWYFWNGIPRLAKDPRLAEVKNTHTLLLSVLGIWGLLLALKRRVHGGFLFAS